MAATRIHRDALVVTPSLLKRFWGKVSKSDDCWNWSGACDPNGYGALKHNGRKVGAHRLSWMIANDKPRVPVGMLVCHHCDNRQCVRPEHLFLGTHSDNMRDAYAKGRLNICNVDNRHLSSLTLEDVREIRRLYIPGVYSAARIAKRLGLPLRSVEGVAYGETWKHVR